MVFAPVEVLVMCDDAAANASAHKGGGGCTCGIPSWPNVHKGSGGVFSAAAIQHAGTGDNLYSSSH